MTPSGRVRNGHRDAVDADDQPDAEVPDQSGDCGDEPLPLDVGLWARLSRRNGVPVVVGEADRQLRSRVALEVILDEEHLGAAGSVVDEIRVESCDDAMVEGGEQVVGQGLPAPPASMKPSRESTSTARPTW